jgi:hypothetical protein
MQFLIRLQLCEASSSPSSSDCCILGLTGPVSHAFSHVFCMPTPCGPRLACEGAVHAGGQLEQRLDTHSQ